MQNRTDRVTTLCVGVDEAGYGPNLGPLVVCATTFHGPADVQDWWSLLSPIVGRAGQSTPIVVDDSKRVLARSGGSALLQTAVHAFLEIAGSGASGLAELFAFLAPHDLEQLRREHWFGWLQSHEAAPPGFASPTAGESTTTIALAAALAHSGLSLAAIRSRVLFPRAFNEDLVLTGNKAAVEARLVLDLLADLLEYPGASTSVDITVDRLGGRRCYRTFVEELSGSAFPQTTLETAKSSAYCFTHSGREVTIAFNVKADQSSFPVALASMTAKYLRERCMAAFNGFWQHQDPGLAPTAGYPEDARRFRSAIAYRLEPLGITLAELWRDR
jgi:hypothetical protein